MQSVRMEVLYRDLGRMGYGECWALQRALFDAVLREKGARPLFGETLDTPVSPPGPQQAGWLLTVEHDPVYTLGKSGKESNMLVGEAYLRSIGAEYYHIDRGGDVTFHGPGQIVAYPVIDLERVGIGLRDYIDRLEGAVIDTVAEWGVAAGRIAGASGVWVDCDGARARKICAIGVRSSRFVTMHGLALNVSTDLRYFSHINPCGFTDRGVTSLERETGVKVDFEEVKRRLVRHLTEKLNVRIYK